MKSFLEKLDLWVYNLLGYSMLLLNFMSKGDTSIIWLCGGATMFGIQAIIWRLNDLNKK